MQSLQILIDKAAEICGSDSALARRLEISPQAVSSMRKGKMPISPAMAGDLALIAGLDPLRAVNAAAIAELARTPRGQRVKDAIEKGFLGIVAATCVFSATDSHARGSYEINRLVDTTHIVLSFRRMIFAWRKQFTRTRPRLA